MDRTQRVYISSGTNMGDRKANLKFALDSLASRATVSKVSSYYETEPVGFLDQPWFLNQVIELITELAPFELLSFCLDIEASRGRIRHFPNAPRTLDLDILLYGDRVVSEAGLRIPHPRMAEREFVLRPLAELCPERQVPGTGETVQELWERARGTRG